MRMIQAAPEAMAAILLCSIGEFCFVKWKKRGRLPKGSMMIKSGIKIVVKDFIVSIAAVSLQKRLSCLINPDGIAKVFLGGFHDYAAQTDQTD